MEPPEWVDDSHLLFFYCTSLILLSRTNLLNLLSVLVKFNNDDIYLVLLNQQKSVFVHSIFQFVYRFVQ